MLDGNGNVLQDGVDLYGETIIFADFEDNSIGGELFFTTGGREGVNVPFNVSATLLIDEADIVGNGFSTTASAEEFCNDGLVCSSNTIIGGAFFGPNGEEVSGLVGLDYTETEDLPDGDSIQVIGAGGYVATQNELELN